MIIRAIALRPIPCTIGALTWRLSTILALLFGAWRPAFATYVRTNLPAPALQREFRGAWVATLNNIDWPSKPGLPVEEQKRELLRILDRARQINLNAILFQVRPGCDAFYESRIEPWSEYLTGRMGSPPAPWYDPLAFAVEEAHRRGLELHAWFNPFRARHVSATNAPSSKHISKTRAQWVRTYGKDLWLDPGESDVRDYSLNVILDVAKRYDVDAIVMDDYFYPYKEKDRAGKLMDFPDWGSWNRYRTSGGKLSRDDWRRNNINEFVQRLYAAIKSEKPYLKVGLSPFGIWRPKFPAEIQGLDAYQHLYADSKLWLNEGWVDYFAPQLYWSTDAPHQGFAALLKWWAEQNTKARHLWPAGSASRISTNFPAAQIVRQVNLTRNQPGARGNIHWSFTPLLRNTGGIGDALLGGVYQDLALVPPSPWLSTNPVPSVRLDVQEQSNGLAVSLASDSTVRFWLLQTQVGGQWKNEILPGIVGRQLLTVRPDAVSVRAIDRCGLVSLPAVYSRVDP